MSIWARGLSALSGWLTGRSPVDQNSIRPYAVPFLTPNGAIQTRPELVPAYQACVSAISQSLAKVPLRLSRVESTKGGYPISYSDMLDNPLYSLLMYRPNPYQTSMQFREALAINAIQDGNAYAYIQRDCKGIPIALHSISPNNIADIWLFPQTQQLFYRVNNGGLPFGSTDPNGLTVVDQADMIHVTNAPSFNRAWRGVSAQENLTATLQLAGSQQDAAFSYLYNGGGQILIGNFNATVSDEQKKQWVANMRAGLAHQGAGVKSLVSDEACKIESIQGINPDDQQYIDSRKMTSQDICMYMGVPPAIIGLDTNLKYNTYSQQWQSFRSGTLDTWAKRVEEAFESKLIPESQYGGVIIYHDFEELLRNDPEYNLKKINSLGQFQAITVNEARLLAGLPPMAGGDRLALPAGSKQMQPEEPANAD